MRKTKTRKSLEMRKRALREGDGIICAELSVVKTEKAYLAALCGVWLVIVCASAVVFGQTGFYCASFFGASFGFWYLNRFQAPERALARVKRNPRRR